MFIFGDKAMTKIELASLPKHIEEMISAATICAVGHTCFIDVKHENDFEPIVISCLTSKRVHCG